MKYRSQRARAWRNAMVAAINAGLEQKLFSLEPGSGTWPSSGSRESTGCRIYNFKLSDIPAIAAASDAGYDELSIHVALWPTPNARQAIQAGNAGFYAGDLFAAGWVERRQGRWLQRGPSIMRCRAGLATTVAALKIEPTGYADYGKFML
jgi:hypothetical protein